MKKIIALILPLFLVISLVACSNKKSESDKHKEETGKVSLTVKFDEKNTKEFKDIPINADSTVITVLREKVQVEESKGFITAIDGVKQDESANKFWLYKLNGEMANKGAGEQELKDGDKIYFELGSM
ncbi:DUF4430 domain-containing protein [Floricoccus penangensis]|uniref:Transcobalamin-like C-terminal domain-containing protein n=1 Tax=Floricoccus penangensis TaxID=1859475 RepID=A0A9Q5JFH1_9LACT|nr:DUF4430 domain-containing protein [Floricoccus penangensis]OFI45834.1 hypothetical protein BG262_07495 [Floricoccus penangensis]URZ87984.1 DUF4430 domain-containing protein [Floricoccus penangensis]